MSMTSTNELSSQQSKIVMNIDYFVSVKAENDTLLRLVHIRNITFR